MDELMHDMMAMYTYRPHQRAMELLDMYDAAEDGMRELLKQQGWRHRNGKYGFDEWWESKTGQQAETMLDAVAAIAKEGRR